jgi:hypothetical protein
MQTIGVTDLTITYSRPGVKGRVIWGDAPTGAASTEATLDNQNTRPKGAVIVPYGHVWRTGANEATVFSVTDDVLLNGQKLAAGTYSLHSIPTPTEWTIIINSDSGQWGSFTYDDKKDVLRFKVKPQTVADNQEWLQYTIPVFTPNSAQVLIRWEKIAVTFTVEVPNIEANMKAKAEALMAANPTEWRLPWSLAAQYQSEQKWDEALKYADQSIKIKETFQNLSRKARILVAAGRKEQAIPVAEQAIERGKADKENTAAFEKWLADLKAGKN